MQLGVVDIEYMIQRSLVERSWREKHECPTTFYVGCALGQELERVRMGAKEISAGDFCQGGFLE
jgi:hypothetical protein